jgi:hypothetical protein
LIVRKYTNSSWPIQFFFIFWPHPPVGIPPGGRVMRGCRSPTNWGGPPSLRSAPLLPLAGPRADPECDPLNPLNQCSINNIGYRTQIFRIKRIRFRILARW